MGSASSKRVAILYSSSQNSLLATDLCRQPHHPPKSRNPLFIKSEFSHELSGMFNDPVADSSRNPLFIKSEFSRGMGWRGLSDDLQSQSFIHQVRILSLIQLKTKKE